MKTNGKWLFTSLIFSVFLCSGPSLFAQSSALHLAAMEGDLTEVRSLLEAGVDINSRMTAGWTPLMISAKYGHEKVMATLLRSGADPNLQNDTGNTALMVAVAANRPDMVRGLLQSNVRLDIKNSRDLDAIQMAELLGYTDILSILRNHADQKG